MNITREDMPGRQVALTIELDPEVINSALERAYRQMVNQVNIPGFRRGKAPRYILESYVGKEALTEKAVKNILPQAVQDAITDQKIEAMDVGDVEIVGLDPLQVKVIIVQPPSIELGDYGSIRVEREAGEVTEEQIEDVLTGLRREGAPWNEPAEPRPLREGDMVYLNLEGFTGEGELEEARREEFPTIVGAKNGSGVPRAIHAELVDMSVGEEKDIAALLPEDYANEALRGRDVTYHVKVLSMKEQELKELDEEYVKQLGYDTPEALRESVEKNLRQRIEEAAESNQVSEAIRQMVESSTVEMPDVMVNEELDLLLKKLEERLREQRLSLRQYFTFNGTSEREWREANRERAMERLVRGLVLQEFASREGLAVEDAEIEGEIETMLSAFEGEQLESARSVLAQDQARHTLQDRIFERKLFDRLVGIVEGRIEAAPPPAEEEATSEGEEPPTNEAASEGETTPMDEGTKPESDEEEASAATDLESAGGAAAALGTEGVDISSPYETGEAEGGGTPTDAPRLEGEDKG